MTDLSNVDLTDPNVRAQLGLEERTEGGPEEPTPPGQQQGALKHVREAAEQAIREKREAEAQLALVQRELAVERAGLPDSPMKELFLKAYDGPAEADAIKAEAMKYGLLNADGAPPAPSEAPTPATPAVPQAELDAHRAVAAAASASSPGGDIPLEQALLGAKNAEEVMRILQQAPSEAQVHIVPPVLP